jgi:hypothetical protein
MTAQIESEFSSIGKPRESPSQIARHVLVAFLFTFLASRVLVLLIMSRRMPDLFLHMGGTHVHHLNYGIFLLCGVGAWMLFYELTGKKLKAAALIYGVGLGLTFDEFGMWLHLGGGYWQRASFDAVVVIAALLSLIAAAPSFKRLKTQHWVAIGLMLISLLVFAALATEAVLRESKTWGPKLQKLEQQGPQ